MSFFLCGQTGNTNRGCEAIIRSTVKVLNQRNGDIYVATFAPMCDRAMVRELGINMIPYKGYPTSIHRYACGAIRKIFKRSVVGTKYVTRDLYAHMTKDDLCLNIGGDTYCYSRPLYSIALTRHAKKRDIDTILWCCSVEKDTVKGELKEDLLRYKYIFAREQLTYQGLLEQGIPGEKVVKVCDPAFFLDRKEAPLPEGFAVGNTVGLNVSECVVKEDGDHVYENVLHMARHILNDTDMSICLIPHVYDIEKNICDWPILQKIKADLNSDRVCIVEQEYDCEQLKYIISHCRFMVCARTHASIAAYSTEVPTLVLGYSVKSKGIARDLFGTDENYVVSYTDLTEKHELTDAFDYIVDHEQEIRDRLHRFLPEYKAQLSTAVHTYINRDAKTRHICDENLCSGCGACATICPKQCIAMTADQDGFLRPFVDTSVCIQCGRCEKICPVANKNRDDGQTPRTFAAVYRDAAVRERSSSGGVFYALAKHVIDAGGVVLGASFDQNFAVVHTYVENLDELTRIQGSKYVQSCTGDAYVQAKKFLDEGRLVLFTGTPCQIGGLYAYLNCMYDNLITQDVVCHGVPSPKLWENYVKEQEVLHGSKVTAVSFRDKKSGWKTYSVSFGFENGDTASQILNEDPYMRAFLSHLALRPACHECSFKQVHRVSDITLADFWGVEKLFPEKNDNKGISLVMCHSRRGEQLFSSVKDNMDVWPVDFENGIKDNVSMIKSSPASPLRQAFLNEVGKKRLDKLSRKYCGKSVISRARRMMAKMK